MDEEELHHSKDQNGETYLQSDDTIYALHNIFSKIFTRDSAESNPYFRDIINSSNELLMDDILTAPEILEITADLDLIKDAIYSCKSFIVMNDVIKSNVKPEQNTLILRDIPSTSSNEAIMEVFTQANCPIPISLRSDMNDTWYATFASEEDAKAALVIRKFKFGDNLIKVALKAEISQKSFYNEKRPPSAFPINTIPGDYPNLPSSINMSPNYINLPYNAAIGAGGVMGMGPVGGMFFGHYPIPPPPPFGPTFPLQNGVPMMGYGHPMMNMMQIPPQMTQQGQMMYPPHPLVLSPNQGTYIDINGNMHPGNFRGGYNRNNNNRTGYNNNRNNNYNQNRSPNNYRGSPRFNNGYNYNFNQRNSNSFNDNQNPNDYYQNMSNSGDFQENSNYVGVENTNVEGGVIDNNDNNYKSNSYESINSETPSVNESIVVENGLNKVPIKTKEVSKPEKKVENKPKGVKGSSSNEIVSTDDKNVKPKVESESNQNSDKNKERNKTNSRDGGNKSSSRGKSNKDKSGNKDGDAKVETKKPAIEFNLESDFPNLVENDTDSNAKPVAPVFGYANAVKKTSQEVASEKEKEQLEATAAANATNEKKEHTKGGKNSKSKGNSHNDKQKKSSSTNESVKPKTPEVEVESSNSNAQNSTSTVLNNQSKPKDTEVKLSDEVEYPQQITFGSFTTPVEVTNDTVLQFGNIDNGVVKTEKESSNVPIVTTTTESTNDSEGANSAWGAKKSFSEILRQSNK